MGGASLEAAVEALLTMRMPLTLLTLRRKADGRASAGRTEDPVLCSSDWAPPEAFWKARAEATDLLGSS